MCSAGSNASSPGRARAGGFSLLEVLVVMTILIMAFAITVPAIGGSERGELRRTAREMASALRHARSEAIISQSPQALLLDTRLRRYGLAGGQRRGDWSDSLELRFTTAESQRLDENRGRVMFFPDGSSTGARLELSRRDQEFQIDVEWLTGAVRLAASDPDG